MLHYNTIFIIYNPPPERELIIIEIVLIVTKIWLILDPGAPTLGVAITGCVQIFCVLCKVTRNCVVGASRLVDDWNIENSREGRYEKIDQVGPWRRAWRVITFECGVRGL